MHRILRHKLFWLALLASLAIAIYCGAGSFSLDRDQLHGHFQHADWGVALFIVAHIIATMVGLPGTLLVMVGGSVFGLLWGTLWSVIGATLGAIAAFSVARYLLRDWIEQRFATSRHLHRLNGTIGANSLVCVVVTRLAPVSPFSLVNFLFGLTQISLQPYAIGTLVGILPGTLLYTWLGIAGMEAIDGGSMVPIALAIAALLGLSVLPSLVASHRR
ncbi:MAG: TVP38/TMEM64 family protein [Elainellaceae cyanobacterium]